jgi:hypothetical protein
VNTPALTLTYYIRHLDDGRTFHYAEAPSPEALRALMASSGGQVETVSRTYRVGARVKVRAYGAWRRGTVTKLGRTRVTVTYLRNQHGTRASKSFGATQIRPGS